MTYSKSIRILAFLLLICLLASPAAFAKEYRLTILHTNDHHGHFQKFAPFPATDVGGLAAQSTMVNIIRAEVENAGGHVLVLSAGDINTGVPESDLLDAEPDIKMMNMIGYDAMTLGNHEFDNPLDVLMKQQELAEFPFLSANLFKKGTGELLVKPYIMKEFDEVKVAILGLTTPRTKFLDRETADIEFKSAIEVAQELVPTLREEADIVIALTHLSLHGEAGGEYDEPGDIKLAEAVQGIDIIVGGHSHTALTEPEVVGDTLIVQAGAYSQYVGRLNITLDSDADKITDYSYELMPVNMKQRVKYNDKQYFMYVGTGYVEDKEILDMTTPYLESADELLSQPIGETLVELIGSRKEVRSQETNLGNLTADAQRAKTGADIAFQNGGGIRAGIAPGTITYRDALTVHPFGNTLVMLDMTGEQMMEALNYAATLEPGVGAFPHVSGLKCTLNKRKGVAENVMVGDAPIDLEKTYKVVVNIFLAGGGDGYTIFKEVPQYETGFVDADALVEYIQKLGKVDPKVEGRITIVE